MNQFTRTEKIVLILMFLFLMYNFEGRRASWPTMIQNVQTVIRFATSTLYYYVIYFVVAFGACCVLIPVAWMISDRRDRRKK